MPDIVDRSDHPAYRLSQSAEVSNLELPALIGGKYRPLRLLGKGGMGAVYEAEHEHTGQHVALKILTQQPGASVERFKREARAASLIQSEHIVRVTDADFAPELGGAPYLVMELLDGQDLERATHDEPSPPADVIEWLRQVSRALVKAHDAGLVHRDLKPENVFLTQRDDGSPLVKLLDFGIAKMAAEASPLTASDAFLGTPGYMAPEQTDSRGPPVTFRADLYAMGLIAFKLLTGRSYWRSGSLAQLLVQILAEPMPPASERGSTFGSAFDAWFSRACDRDPEKRFASAREQVEALATALGLPEDSRRPSEPTRRSRTPSAHEKQGASSLNASVSDLTTAKRKTARRRLFGGGVMATVVAGGTAFAVLRGAAANNSNVAASRDTGPPPETSSMGMTRLPSEPAPSSAPPAASSRLDAVASASSPPAAPVASAARAPAAANATAKTRSPSAPASTPISAAADASRPRDPLEGPW